MHHRLGIPRHVAYNGIVQAISRITCTITRMSAEHTPAHQLHQLVETIRHCTRCRLHQTRTHAVPGDGPFDADIMFIGEAPGYHEDRQGRPFVGAAGKYLNDLLARNGLDRSRIYITNILKCRPPRNRDPLPDEIAACRPFLERQIALINPRIIVTLGRFALQFFFPNASITRVHGQARQKGGRWYFPTFHPAAALHQPRWQPLIEEDFRKLAELLQALTVSEGPVYHQLSLFPADDVDSGPGEGHPGAGTHGQADIDPPHS